MNKSWIKKLTSVVYCFVAFHPFWLQIFSLWRSGNTPDIDFDMYDNVLTPVFSFMIDYFDINAANGLIQSLSWALVVSASFLIFNVLHTFINYISNVVERWLD